MQNKSALCSIGAGNEDIAERTQLGVLLFDRVWHALQGNCRRRLYRQKSNHVPVEQKVEAINRPGGSDGANVAAT